MKRKLFLIVLLCSLAWGSVQAQTIVPQVSETVELMGILSKIAGFPEYNMDLGGTYIDDINNHFASQKSHPAVLYMQELRRNHGISYDAVISMAVHLQQQNGRLLMIEEEVPTLEGRWQSVDKEQFLSLLNQFYRDANFHTFFQEHQELYRKGLKVYQDSVMQYLDMDWYYSFYGCEPQEAFSILIGFCNGGGNYGTSRHLKGEKKEVFAIVGYNVDETNTPLYTKDYFPTLIHEFNHSFVNYLLDDKRYPLHVEQLEPSATMLLQTSWWSMSWQAYGNWQIVINESIVRAVVVCYMLDHDYPLQTVREEVSEQLQRNFRWMPELVMLLRKYEKKQQKYQSLENFYPNIIAFFSDYADREDKKLRAIR